MLILILAESALETVPKSLWEHPSVKRYSEQRGKPPQFNLLDRSYHHEAMKTLEENWKRGRPDIVHFSLLEALGSPLNREGILKVFVHTNQDYVISMVPETRLPRNYMRFIGLIEQLFEHGMVPKTGKALLTLQRKGLPKLLNEIKPTYVVAFSRIGRAITLEEAISRLSNRERLAVIIGGFPTGHFTKTTTELVDEVINIDPDMLEAWTLTSRVIYEYERAVSLVKKRLKR